MADEQKPKTVDDDPNAPKRVKNRSRDPKAATRWPACPKCENEAHNTTYHTHVEAKPGATPVTHKMMECSKCGERMDLDTGMAVGRKK